ncbi:MAG: MBL fold metallo-hydrolase [Ferruginibacter sp.]
MRKIIVWIFLFALHSCAGNTDTKNTIVANTDTVNRVTGISLIVLGTIQDAGSPQIGCTKDCCKGLFGQPDKNRKVVSLGIIDPAGKKKFILEATPDIAVQARILNDHASFGGHDIPDGIFITHAHIGHYSGLMYLGKEAMNTDSVPVYTMPRLKAFLEQNGPWSQLIKNRNIVVKEMHNRQEIQLTPALTIIPFTVPHRDEFSETVGYRIIGPNKKVLFIPDIDKWEKWGTKIIEAISKVDYAFIDATFYDAAEINNRDISTIPHPFVIESMKLFEELPSVEKKKIYFIHFNHTNPLINKNSKQAQLVLKSGFNIASINDTIKL